MMRVRDLPGAAWRRVRRAIDPRQRLIAKVRAGKQARAASPHVHTDNPQLSLIVLSFNHRSNVAAIMHGLRRTIGEEIIVCDDGSIDGAEREWQRHLTRPNDFLLRSNDIHDSRAYNRAAALARGGVICILQDDDIPPASGAWAAQALALFEQDRQLAVLGGHQGWVLDLSQAGDKVRARHVYGYREERRWTYAKDIPFRDPASGQPFMYVQGVSIGPIFYRRDVFLELGGFNLDYSCPGEVGMLVDHELSIRAWQAGHRVAVFGPVPFRRYVGGQGTLMFGQAERERNLARSFRRLQREQADRIAAIDAAADALNRQLPPAGNAAGIASTSSGSHG
jgi:hypothetical protein